MIVSKKIQEIRKQLNRAIEDERDFEEIYKLSTELDELIIEYYKEK